MFFVTWRFAQTIAHAQAGRDSPTCVPLKIYLFSHLKKTVMLIHGFRRLMILFSDSFANSVLAKTVCRIEMMIIPGHEANDQFHQITIRAQ
jgi:hypothetical protein